jgi:precorrin-3B synthase
LGIALAFGHARTHDLECLADAGQRAGADGIRTAPERVLLIVGIAAHRLSILTAAAERLGFIVDPADPRRNVITCAGAPVCASAQIPTRPLAPVIADIAGGWRPDDLEIHLSGCSKGCAHGGPAALTLVGTRSGCGVVTGGTARDGPVITIPTSRLPQAVANLMRAADQARLPGERLSDALARFEPARVAALMAGQRT